MKTNYKFYYFSSVFLLISLFLCSVIISIDKQRTDKEIFTKREELSYLSSMMKILANAIDNDDDDCVRLASAMIERSGVISYLNNENRENATEFINILTDGYVDKNKAAAYARKCSAAAISIIQGTEYEIGRYEQEQKEKMVSFNSFEYKRQVRYSSKEKKINNISFNGFVNDESVCCRRANVYYLTKINEDEIYEYIYIPQHASKSKKEDVSVGKAMNIAKECMKEKNIADYKYLFSDDGTSFIICIYKTDRFLLGIDNESGRTTHFKKLN